MKKRVFILGGGNTKLAFSIGACKALEQAGITPDILIGNSGGALAAWWISHLGADKAYEYAYNIGPRGRYLRLNWRRLFWDGLYDAHPLFKVLEDIASEKQKVPAYYAFTDHADGTFNIRPELKYCVASICEPFWIKGVDGRYYDGGNMSQVPNQRVFELYKGDEHEFYVFLNNPVRTSLPGAPGTNAISVALRGIDIQTHEAFMDDYRLIMREPRVKAVLHPHTYLYKPFTFDRKEIRRALYLGEVEAQRWLKSR